jgi:hypothetical protein
MNGGRGLGFERFDKGLGRLRNFFTDMHAYVTFKTSQEKVYKIFWKSFGIFIVDILYNHSPGDFSCQAFYCPELSLRSISLGARMFRWVRILEHSHAAGAKGGRQEMERRFALLPFGVKSIDDLGIAGIFLAN